jgi:hypothetical protein
VVTRIVNPGATQIVDPTSGRNRTATHLSTNIFMLVNGIAVSAVQSLQVTEQRGLKFISEVGTDGAIDSAPNESTRISGSCNRVRFNRQRIAESMGRSFVHVAAQRIPFDIEIHDNFAGSDDESKIITTVRNVWIERIGYSYSATDFVIVDELTWQGESIDSVLGNGLPVVGPVNNIGVPIAVNPFEQQADIGIYRGALDASGLISAFDGDGGRSL